VIFLLARISRERKALANIRMSLEQSLDLLTEEVLDLAWLFGLVVSDFEDGELGQAKEELDPRHFYAAYVFAHAHERGEDVAALIEQAQLLGYPVRYWWLSQAMGPQGNPDRLIVCVHHPSMAEDAGMDLYEALEERQVTWDGLEALLWMSTACSGGRSKVWRSSAGATEQYSFLQWSSEEGGCHRHNTVL
jgi:hypothetical protein